MRKYKTHCTKHERQRETWIGQVEGQKWIPQQLLNVATNINLTDAEYVVSSVVKQDGGREVNPDNNHVLTTGGQPPWPTSALNKTEWESTHRSLYNSGYEDVERSYIATPL